MATPGVEQHPGFKLIRVRGGPYERGYQHGSLLRDQVRLLRRVFYREVVYFHGRALGLALRGVMAPFLLTMHRHIPADLRLEMRGVADGAGVPYWDILTFNCFDDLLHALWRIPPLLARVPYLGNRFACSSYTLLAERTSSGRLLQGRNLDYEVANAYLAGDGAVTRALRANVVVVEYLPARGHAFLSVTWPGFVGVVTGMSQAGLAVSCLTSTLSGETPNGLPMPLLYRRITQFASSLDDAERLARGTKLTIGNNLMVASAGENDARVLELSPRFIAVRRPRNGFLASTNHFVHAAMALHQNGWVVPNSLDRLTRLEEVGTNGSFDALQACGLLRDNAMAELGLWSCIENPGTIYSSVAEPETGRLWLRVNDREDRDFVALSGSWAVQAPAATSA